MGTKALLASCILATCSLTAQAEVPPAGVDATQEVERRLEAIEREAKRLSDANQPNKARDLTAAVEQARQRLAGKDVPPPAGLANEPEVHVVGVYEGLRPSVDLRITDRPVILVLCAYENVDWQVTAAKGVRLQKVILAGYHNPSLNLTTEAGGALPPVDVHAYDSGGQNYFYAYDRDAADSFPRMTRAVRALTGRDATTFQGRYRGDAARFVIDPLTADVQAQRVLDEIRPVHVAATAFDRARREAEVARLRFTALTHRAAGPIRLATWVGEFSPLGPVGGPDKLTPLPANLTRAAIDPAAAANGGPTYYALAFHAIVRTDLKIDPATGQVKTEALELPPHLPKLSWPCAIAFDTKRRRAVVATKGGKGHLYALDVAKNEWSVLSELNNVDLQALTYSAKDDCFYALPERRGRDRANEILRYGAAVGQRRPDGVNLRFTPPASSAHPTEAPSQLVALDDGTLALILPPGGRDDVPAAAALPPTATRCLLIDPKTGDVTYAGEMR